MSVPGAPKSATPLHHRAPARVVALKIAVTYAVISSIWILLSGTVLHSLVHDPDLVGTLENVKGWFFVAVTALLLGWVLYRYFRELEQSTELLRESEQRWQFALEGTEQGMWDWDMQTDEVFRSDQWKILLGYEPHEIGSSRDESDKWLYPDDQARVQADLERHLNGLTPAFLSEYRVRRKDGSVRWISARGKVLRRSADGRPLRMVGTQMDITARKESEQFQLLATEVVGILNDPQAPANAMQRILGAIKRETSFDAVGIRLRQGDDFPYIGADGFSQDFLEAENRLAIRDDQGGVCRDEQGRICLSCTCGLVLSGKVDPAKPGSTPGGSLWVNEAGPVLKLSPQEDQRLKPRNRCLHEGFESVALIPIRMNQVIVGLLQLNDRRKGRFSLELVRYFEGLAASFGLALLRMREEQALRRSEERLRFALEQSHTGGWELDLTDQSAHRTLQHDRIFGYEQMLPDWNYKLFLEHVLPDDRPSVDQRFRQAVQAQTDWSFECRIRRRDGQVRWIWAAGGHQHEAGKARRMAGIVQDITERKEAEQQVHELNRTLDQRVLERTAELRAANDELDAFAYAVSHDLRAPLRAMSGFSQALLEDFGPALPPDAKGYLNEIQRGSQRMGDLINGLLRLSRSTRTELHRERIDLTVLAERILKQFKAAEPQRVVTWAVVPGLVAHGDAGLLEVVLTNVLGNAWKYTAHCAAATIQIEGRTDNQETVLSINDNGAGFDMDHAARLFRPFQRLHREDEFPGLGIGLATVQRILHRHGGQIEANGAPGRGATFTIHLPRSPREEPKPL